MKDKKAILRGATPPRLSHEIESLLRSAISSVPYVGTLLNEILFEYRSRVKQDRLNAFIEQLETEIRGRGEIGPQEMTPALSDFVETVLARAMKVNTIEKRDRLASILIGRIVNYTPVDFEEQFIALVCELTEKQFEILSMHFRFNEVVPLLYREMRDLDNEIASLYQRIGSRTGSSRSTVSNEEVNSIRLEIRQLVERKNNAMRRMPFSSTKRSAAFYLVDQAGYASLIYDMIGRGLMHDVGLEMGGYQKLEVLEVTSYGRKFVEYVAHSQEQEYYEIDADSSNLDGICLKHHLR